MNVGIIHIYRYTVYQIKCANFCAFPICVNFATHAEYFLKLSATRRMDTGWRTSAKVPPALVHFEAKLCAGRIPCRLELVVKTCQTKNSCSLDTIVYDSMCIYLYELDDLKCLGLRFLAFVSFFFFGKKHGFTTLQHQKGARFSGGTKQIVLRPRSLPSRGHGNGKSRGLCPCPGWRCPK